MESKRIAVLPGPRASFLDHLAPLCDLLEMPLHCADPWIAHCASLFYPKIEVVEGELSDYNTFYVVEPCRLYPNCLQFGDQFYRGEGKTIAGFHGNPKKFLSRFWLERYVNEDIVLIYGEQLRTYLEQKGVLQRLKKVVEVGHLRYLYYKKYQAFFDAVVDPFLFPQNGRKTIFWAPTWSYLGEEESSLFEQLFPQVLKSLPAHIQLLIKPHPYMFRLSPEKIEKWRSLECDQVRFIGEIPLVFPFLNRTDIYIGDYSSVVYDFLPFDRPLFVLRNETDIRKVFKKIEEPDLLHEERKNSYRYAFKQDIDLKKLKESIS